jgi:hypothetical protein
VFEEALYKGKVRLFGPNVLINTLLVKYVNGKLSDHVEETGSMTLRDLIYVKILKLR